MKKLIAFFVLIFQIMTIGYAQITKPKINTKINSKELKKENLHKGLNISKLKKLTLDDLKKLKVPVASYSNTLLQTRARSQWKITPIKPVDGNLKWILFNGHYSSSWWEARSFITCDLSDEYIRRTTDRIRTAGTGIMRSISAFGVSFRATAGKEYRVKIKLHAYESSNNSYYIGTSTEICEVFLNNRKEINFIFYAPEAEYVPIYCTGRIVRSSGQIIDLGHLPIEYFQVEELP